MASINMKYVAPAVYTGEGAIARRITPLQELIRLTMACMLWEDNFYSDGKSVADRIKELVHDVTLEQAAGVAIEARNKMKLRHVPLLIVREMARHPNRNTLRNISTANSDYNAVKVGANSSAWVSKTLAEVIQRPDELTEFLAIYWKDGKQPLSKQVKLGLAKAFTKFNEYQLAKYNRDKDITLKDVLFLCHSKPKDVPKDAVKFDKLARQNLTENTADNYRRFRPEGPSKGEYLYGALIYDQLASPETWENRLSSGEDKASVFRDLMAKNELGDLAFLRNLRNMTQVGVSNAEIAAYGAARKWGRVLPFRFIAAAKVVPQLEPHLEQWMFKCLDGSKKFRGKTVLLADVSSSMQAKLSGKSDLTRDSAMKALAMLLREVCEDFTVIPFARGCVINMQPRRGFGLAELLHRHGGPDGTDIGNAVKHAGRIGYDRLIVLTDEQSATQVPNPLPEKLAYMVNVANERHGIGYGQWLHIDGFSEAIVDYMQQYEAGLE